MKRRISFDPALALALAVVAVAIAAGVGIGTFSANAIVDYDQAREQERQTAIQDGCDTRGGVRRVDETDPFPPGNPVGSVICRDGHAIPFGD